jgi:hypothetical protein
MNALSAEGNQASNASQAPARFSSLENSSIHESPYPNMSLLLFIKAIKDFHLEILAVAFLAGSPSDNFPTLTPL